MESWNSKFGTNIFSSILPNVPDSEFANTWIRDEAPDSDFCKRNFRISEPKMIRSVLLRNTKKGKEVFCNQSTDGGDQKDLSWENELYNKNRQKRSHSKLMVRELLSQMEKNAYDCGKRNRSSDLIEKKVMETIEDVMQSTSAMVKKRI